MCVTKKKQKNMRSTRAFGAIESTTIPASATPGGQQTPAGGTQSKTQSNEKSKIKKVQASKEKSRKGGKASKSEAEKNSENQERTSELKKLTQLATCRGPPPPVLPPIKRNAKREVNGEKDAKDPDYVTLNDVMPRFENAKLKNYTYKDSKEKTIRIEPTQPSSGDEKNNKKSSGEKSAATGGEKKE